MAKDPLGLYDDCIVIPFEIPWEVSPHPDPNPQATLARLAHSLGAAWPVGYGGEEFGEGDRQQRDAASSAAPPSSRHDFRKPDPVDVSWPADEGQLVVASIRGHPSLVISGVSNGELTLWRRKTEASHAVALASLKLDLDRSLLDPLGQFLGWLNADETAGLHPDWLHSIGADLPSRAPEAAQSEPAAGQIDGSAGNKMGYNREYVTPRPRGSIAKANRLLFWMRAFLKYTEKRVPPNKQPPTGP